MARRIAAGFDVFRQTRTYDDYQSETTGATVRFGLPITEALTTQTAYTFAREEYEFDDDCLTMAYSIRRNCDVSQAIVDGVLNSPWNKSAVSETLIYNTIDDMKNPHSGIYANGDASSSRVLAATPNM